MYKLVSSFILIFLCTAMQAQKYSTQSLGGGLLLGAGNFNNAFPITFGYGLKVDYQRNLAPWFSLRAELAYATNQKATEYRTTDLPGEFSEFTSKPSALSFGITPLLFGRYQYVNIFVGASIGVASVWNKQDLTSAFYDENNELVNNYQVYPTFTDVAFGINPTLGVNIPIGGRRRDKGELEFALTMNRWVERFYLFEDKPSYRPLDYRFYHLQLTYRFILD